MSNLGGRDLAKKYYHALYRLIVTGTTSAESLVEVVRPEFKFFSSSHFLIRPLFDDK